MCMNVEMRNKSSMKVLEEIHLKDRKKETGRPRKEAFSPSGIIVS
jgi:hypothetical protein